MKLRVSFCCCCCCWCPLRTGILIFTILETAAMLFLVALAVKRTLLDGFIYSVLPFYLTTILFYFPNIVSYFLLCCRRQNHTLSQRKCYYYTRVYSLIMIVVCALIQIGVAWLYSIRFCAYCRQITTLYDDD